MDPKREALEELRRANDEIKKTKEHICGIRGNRPTAKGYTLSFWSPDREAGDLHIRMIANGWKNANYKDHNRWRIKRGDVFIQYSAGKINIYEKTKP